MGAGVQGPSADYTVSSYSLQYLNIYDVEPPAAGDEDERVTNKINMDGSFPSGLVDTDFNFYTSVHKADTSEPIIVASYKSLVEIFNSGLGTPSIIKLLFNHPRLWLPVFWYDWISVFI